NYWATSAPLEGGRRVEDFLARRPDAPIELQARALRVLGGMAELARDFERAQRKYQRSLRLFQEIGDKAGEVMIVFRLGSIAAKLGERERGRRLTQEALVRFELIGHMPGESMALGSLGLIEVVEGNASRARELYERSAALSHEIGFHWQEA